MLAWLVVPELVKMGQIGLILRKLVVSDRAADKQRCSSKALTNDSHALPWASVGNICESLLVYLLVMLLLIDTRHY